MMMSGFGPRIGEENVEVLHRSLVEESKEQVLGGRAQQPYVGDAAPGSPVTTESVVFAGPFYREKIPRGVRHGELEEETGYRASELIEIGRVDPNPAFLSNRCWTYLALGCRAEGEMNLDPSEEIEVSLLPLVDFARLIDDGTITHSLVIAAHDHLRRGMQRKADWAAKLPPQ